MITIPQLSQIIKPKNDAIALEWYAPMVSLFSKYEINTPQRMASFLSQCGHESANFTVLEENLRYSADGLTKVFKKYFPTYESTNGYARNPQRIASKVYANRLGNGDEASQDGWKYRGRGLIQLTGKDNYTKFGQSVNKSLDETVAYLCTKPGALESACWFWNVNKLNSYADRVDLKGMTKVINGGNNGLDDRITRYNYAIKILSSV